MHYVDGYTVGIKNLTLHEVAEMLDVHYMTVYRYVHEGHLPATKNGTGWVVKESDVRGFRRGPTRRLRRLAVAKKLHRGLNECWRCSLPVTKWV